jgi:hypothetical protein
MEATRAPLSSAPRSTSPLQLARAVAAAALPAAVAQVAPPPGVAPPRARAVASPAPLPCLCPPRTLTSRQPLRSWTRWAAGAVADAHVAVALAVVLYCRMLLHQPGVVTPPLGAAVCVEAVHGATALLPSNPACLSPPWDPPSPKCLPPALPCLPANTLPPSLVPTRLQEEVAKEVKDKVVSYNKDDFFDSMSCEALEKMSLAEQQIRREDIRARMNNQRQTDIETFGFFRSQHGYGRGRGRGGHGRGGMQGGRGYGGQGRGGQHGGGRGMGGGGHGGHGGNGGRGGGRGGRN